MYLNIVNNLSFNSKRARTYIKKKNEDKTTEESPITKEISPDYEATYNSIFYGQLTLNWLRVTN